jgi:hypothetical protein
MRRNGSAWVLFALASGSIFLLCALPLLKPVLAQNESVTTTTEAVVQTVTITTSVTYTISRAPASIDEPPFGPNDFLITAPDVIPLPSYPMNIPEPDDAPLFTALSLIPMAAGILAIMKIAASFRSKEPRRAIPLALNRLSGRIRTRRA